MRVVKFLLCTLVFCNLVFVFSSKALAQLPKPYVPVGQTKDNEWHSLRPYQASPAEIPLQKEEQALLCGNDLIINDIVNCANGECEKISCDRPCPGACGPLTCKVKSKRIFEISFDAFGSELPIAGNTELVAGDKPLSTGVFDRTALGNAINSILQTFLSQPWRLVGDPGWRILWSPITIGKTPGFDEFPPPDITKFKNYADYYEAYMEWRGRACFSTNDIPIIGPSLPDIMLCSNLIGGVFNPNFWADLYPKIPYSSTEDRIGKATVYGMEWDKGKSSVDYITPDPPQTDFQPHEPAYGEDPNIQQIPGQGKGAYGETPLYFPHLEENVELSALLQSTYLPKELQTVRPSPGPNVEPLPEPNPDCKIVNVRYNPGDQLFGEKESGKGVPNAKVSYIAYIEKCEAECINPDPETGMCTTLVLLCIRNSWFQSDVTTYTPLIDELFGRTITNESSVLRKTFPRIGDEGNPLGKIEDIPASTGVGHTGQNIKPKSAKLEVISYPAEFYIPHFGSIYDYLLEDMQTLLRPKGFPGKPTGQTKSSTIPEINQANEYLSWYLNGTIYRSEQRPLDINTDCIGESTKIAGNCSLLPKIGRIPDGKSTCYGLPLTACWVNPLIGKKTDTLDRDRVVNQSGPLNKLLSQQSQWRNSFQKTKESFIKKDVDVARVSQPSPRAKVNRHNQIVGCTWGIKLPFSIDIDWPFPIHINEIGGFPTACESESQKNLPPEQPQPPVGPQPPGGCDICQIATDYNVPCCFLKGIWDIETKQSKNIPTGTYGNLQCCNSGGYCGPMQIGGGLLGPLSAGKKFDLCEECDSWELAARLLILKKCVAAGQCNSWNWIEGLQNQFPISESDIWVIGAYYGQDISCFPDNATQCRWGQGKTYCDAVQSWCKTNSSLPDNCTQEYCSQLKPPQTCP